MSDFSYSRINTFNNCPQQYKIIYLDKIRNNHESIEAFMGKRVHEVLEWLYLKKNLKNEFIVFDKLIKKYQELWLRNWHDDIYIAKFKYHKDSYNKNYLYKIGLICLNNYYNKFNNKGYFKEDVYKTELKFNVKIGNFNFRGFIDRIDINKNNSFDIIDYKTGKNTKSLMSAKKDLQLAVYYLAIKKLFPNLNEINLNLFYLRENKFIHIKENKDNIAMFKNKIIKNVIDILNEKIYLPKESMLCEWCYYWDECEIKSSNNPAIRL